MQQHYRPYDRAISLRLDAVIVLLESSPPWYIRLILTWYRRSLERSL